MNKHTSRVVQLLKSLGFFVAIESNGFFAPPEGVDFLTVSPKRDGKYFVHPESYARASEFKVVVDEGFDFNILKDLPVVEGKHYFLSPEFGRFEKSLKEIFEFIKENPRWRVSLQTHKWMNIP